MGRLFLEYLDGSGRVYTCKVCLAGGHGAPSSRAESTKIIHLATSNDLLSKSFHSHHGPAYLFNHAVNVTLGPPEERDMTTGRHVVRNLFCIGCSTVLGWRYEAAYEDAEKYKEGKYILERIQLVNLESEATIGFAGTTSRGESDDYTTTEEGLRRALQAYVGSNSETVMLLGGTL